ncbi:MAG: hypothetical protein NW224_28570 [Leptolyngbyaceae cyanobacterium bins.302]|nr:hypothetical protein [Leptolyngbyaceae cyanobacterium bins.302]
MLPLVIDEQQVFTFKFWFEAQIQTGMQFQNELFCQLVVADVDQRSRLYRKACKLAQQGVRLVITCSPSQCCVWGSLRDELVKQLLVNPAKLHASYFTDDSTNPSLSNTEH